MKKSIVNNIVCQKLLAKDS